MSRSVKHINSGLRGQTVEDVNCQSISPLVSTQHYALLSSLIKVGCKWRGCSGKQRRQMKMRLWSQKRQFQAIWPSLEHKAWNLFLLYSIPYIRWLHFIYHVYCSSRIKWLLIYHWTICLQDNMYNKRPTEATHFAFNHGYNTKYATALCFSYALEKQTKHLKWPLVISGFPRYNASFKLVKFTISYVLGILVRKTFAFDLTNDSNSSENGPRWKKHRTIVEYITTLESFLVALSSSNLFMID